MLSILLHSILKCKKEMFGCSIQTNGCLSLGRIATTTVDPLQKCRVGTGESKRTGRNSEGGTRLTYNQGNRQDFWGGGESMSRPLSSSLELYT
jgi:hypothetical protein